MGQIFFCRDFNDFVRYTNMEQIQKADSPDDPERCQCTATKHGQCPNKRVSGSEFCQLHGGNRATMTQDAKQLSMYRLSKYRERHNEFSTAGNIKTLHEEIGILRILMEEALNSVDSPAALAASTPQLADLASRIERLVVSCHKLEKSLSQYLDKTAIVQLGQETVEIIARYVNDPDITAKIAADLANRISDMENLE